jgi:thioredoxin reductase (NADPH)
MTKSSEEEDAVLDAVVVGGGPAGLTAATYLRRFNRSCVVLDSGDSRARWIPESNNCPGFPRGVSGAELLRRMKEQAASFDTRFESALVDSILLHEEGFVVLAGERRWRARCVVLASGLADKLPDAPWVQAAVTCQALRLCSICDAYEASDTRIGVYGPLADIVAHGLFLRAYSARIALVPTDVDDGVPRLDEAREAGIEILPPGGALGFDGEKCTYTLAQGTVETFDSVYPFLGAYTTAGLVAALGAELSDTGEIVVDRQQMTAVPGLYAIGDVVSGLNQISVAVGQAAIAATAAHNHLPFVPRQAASETGD